MASKTRKALVLYPAPEDREVIERLAKQLNVPVTHIANKLLHSRLEDLRQKTMAAEKDNTLWSELFGL